MVQLIDVCGPISIKLQSQVVTNMILYGGTVHSFRTVLLSFNAKVMLNDNYIPKYDTIRGFLIHIWMVPGTCFFELSSHNERRYV